MYVINLFFSSGIIMNDQQRWQMQLRTDLAELVERGYDQLNLIAVGENFAHFLNTINNRWNVEEILRNMSEYFYGHIRHQSSNYTPLAAHISHFFGSVRDELYRLQGSVGQTSSLPQPSSAGKDLFNLANC